ncbi:MAG: family 20 glycosylhydrolase [Culturomica sp.]|nr:family 20 glycosylhydrolase [Culturomica sp.]
MKKILLILLVGAGLISCRGKEGAGKIAIVPRPVELTVQKGTCRFDSETRIVYGDPALEPVASYLQAVIRNIAGYEPAVSVTETGESVHPANTVLLSIDESLREGDAYRMEIAPEGIRVEAVNPRSALLAVQTIRQLLPVRGTDLTLPALHITDYPAWEWRGLMLDAARHFWNKEEVKRFVDLMALYKFNKFHWHLTDDQGWRIEIKKYPQLTEKAAWRQYNNHDRACMRLAKQESNDDYLLPEDRLRRTGDTVEYGGFYTQDDIREVIAYAAERGIDVIPEIDMPGHFSAAISVMPELACFNATGWGKEFSAPICPGKEGTLEFCRNVFREVFALFPYEYVHLGADEVEKENWKKCPLCQARIRANGLKDEKELQAWFVKRMEAFFLENGKKMIGWDEIIDGGLSQTATVMWWRSWVGNAVHKATAQGNEVILTPNNHYYFDYKQDYSTLRKLYEFEAVPPGLTPEQQKLIKGVQGNTWTEWIPSYRRVEYMTAPRLIAFSEVAWQPDSLRKWEDFYPRLLAHYGRLDEMGVNYRPLDLEKVYTSNAFVGEAVVEWEQPLPAVRLRYTTDGSVPDSNAALYTGPFKLTESADYTIRFFRPDGSAADIVRATYRKETYRPAVELVDPAAGWNCAWHEAVVNSCEEIDKIPVKQEYTVESVRIPEGVGGERALAYTGYLWIEKEDVYTFSLGSDDGSRLYLHEELVVDNDGPHGPVTLMGQIALGKGWHPVRLYYFDMNNGGFVDLKMADSRGTDIELTGDLLKH